MTLPDFELNLKNIFSHSWQLYTVTRAEESSSRVWLAGGGPVKNQHVWVGHDLKDPSFFGNFF
jgi:hypothetical protein